MVEKYTTTNLSIIHVPEPFRPHIRPVYPPNNNIIFEEWFYRNYTGCNTERTYLPILFTSYWVNHNYGNDQFMREALHRYIATLDKSKKYFNIIQYDDGSMINWDMYDLDVLEFNMSKTNGVMIPLVCQPHPFSFTGGKRWFANFIGSKTHPIRESAARLKGQEGYFISFEQTPIETYCRLLHESMFTLCYRGYGLNSFRIAEAVQYGSIPVYISDKFILPFDIDFEDFGILISDENQNKVDEILQSVPIETIVEKQSKLHDIYQEYYTYQGVMKKIIEYLETENAPTS